MLASSGVDESHDVDLIARAMRGELEEHTEDTADSRGRKLRHDSEVMLATLLSGRGDYLNAGAANTFPNPTQTGSWDCKNNHNARKECVRTMASEGDAFIVSSRPNGNFMTASALPKIHTARQLSEVVDMSQAGVCMEYPEPVSYTHLTLPTKA